MTEAEKHIAKIIFNLFQNYDEKFDNKLISKVFREAIVSYDKIFHVKGYTKLNAMYISMEASILLEQNKKRNIAPLKNLDFEHMVPVKKVKQDLIDLKKQGNLNLKNIVDKLSQIQMSCLVTKEEHAKLSNYDKKNSGTKIGKVRYKDIGIKIKKNKLSIQDTK